MRRIGLLRGLTLLGVTLIAPAIDNRAVADPSFAVPIFVYTTEAEPIRSVVCDIDADGRQDVAVLDRAGRAFELFRNSAGNQLARGMPIRMINDPACLVPGDFDADGRIDFLVPGSYQLGRVF